jgi:hypothetical protein
MTDKSELLDDDSALLKRLIIAHADLQMALSAIAFLADEVDKDATYSKVELRRFKCFETTFVVSYSRAFTQNHGSRYGQLSLKRIGVKLDATEKSLHDLIIELRNRIYAHSDEDFAHARVDFGKFETPNGTITVPHLQFEHGLEFAEYFKRMAAMELTSRILHGILLKIRDIGELYPNEFMYVTPSSKGDEINWRETFSDKGIVLDITPRQKD